MGAVATLSSILWVRRESGFLFSSQLYITTIQILSHHWLLVLITTLTTIRHPDNDTPQAAKRDEYQLSTDFRYRIHRPVLSFPFLLGYIHTSENASHLSGQSAVTSSIIAKD